MLSIMYFIWLYYFLSSDYCISPKFIIHFVTRFGKEENKMTEKTNVSNTKDHPLDLHHGAFHGDERGAQLLRRARSRRTSLS